MKQILKWSLILAPMFAAGCQEDVVAPGPTLIGYEEGDVVFTVANDPKTRTMYDENQWDSNEKQSIYWGNYISTDVDNIKVFCKAASQQPICTYKVNPQKMLSGVAESIEKLTIKSMQWGSQNVDHNFYGFYPAEMAGDAFVGDTDNTIHAQVTPGQSPKQYKISVNGGALEVATLQTIAQNTTAELTSKTVVYGDPDMEGAIMVAKQSIPAGSEAFGKAVPLEFQVMADVIDLTINGPIRPNSLGGNEGESNVERAYIKIRSVTIRNANGGTKVLSGSFDINMQTGDVTNVNGNTSVQIVTADEGQYPTLHVRHTGDAPSDPVKDGYVDQLRLRAFLIPGQITNLGELEVVVDTDCGEYTQTLSNVNSFVSGRINPIKLSYFKTRGTPFDYSRWIGQLDPNIYISELSIPGSWHSSNTNNQGNVTLKDQYNAGVRAFEVHTTNGTELKKYGDLTTAFDSATAEYYPDRLNEKDGDITTNAKQTGNLTEGTSSTSETSATFQTSQTQTETQNVTATFNVIQNTASSYQQKPKFSLRLYRTRNVTDANPNPTESFSDALISLAEEMNATGFMFFEFGMESQRSITVPYKNVAVGKTRNGNITRSGTRTRTRTRTRDSIFDAWPDWENSTWSEWTYTWNAIPDNALDGVAWVDDGTSTITYQNQTMDAGEAWAIAIESCLNRLANAENTTTKKKVLYTDPITPNTTISDVQGQVIAKINTNDSSNETSGWSGNTPALFSRWVKGSGAEPLTINLNWGKPIAPDPLNTGDQDLRWCYTELEEVTSTTTPDRENAIKALGNMAYENYKGGLHRTFYECAIGGYLGTNDANGCQELAQKLNPYLLNVLTDPTRNACPFGIVFMNFVIAPGDDQDTYKSKELIRTIINNNAAFLLNRRGASTKQVGDNTNSSFTNNSNNPLK